MTDPHYNFTTFLELGKLGRLGNQMHQIAATVGYAAHNGKAYLFPDWQYNKYLKNPLPEITRSCPIAHRHVEPNFHFDLIPYLPGSVNLSGYFQSHKYFNNINVTELFELAPEYKQLVLVKYLEIRGSYHSTYRTCSIHVRRGDYLNEANKNYHGVLDMDYYDEAVNKLYPSPLKPSDNCIHTKNVQFIVCSDDIAWCKANMKHGNIYFSENEPDIIDLFLMAQCDDHIIANSSFSWWSAYLGTKKPHSPNDPPRVIAPKNWFSGADHSTKDLFPEKWITV